MQLKGKEYTLLRFVMCMGENQAEIQRAVAQQIELDQTKKKNHFFFIPQNAIFEAHDIKPDKRKETRLQSVEEEGEERKGNAGEDVGVNSQP